MPRANTAVETEKNIGMLRERAILIIDDYAKEAMLRYDIMPLTHYMMFERKMRVDATASISCLHCRLIAAMLHFHIATMPATAMPCRYYFDTRFFDDTLRALIATLPLRALARVLQAQREHAR